MAIDHSKIPNDTDADRERFRRRLVLVLGTPLAKQLKHFRNQLTKRDSIKLGDDLTHVVAGTKRGYWHPRNEINICHAFLDGHGVDKAYVVDTPVYQQGRRR